MRDLAKPCILPEHCALLSSLNPGLMSPLPVPFLAAISLGIPYEASLSVYEDDGIPKSSCPIDDLLPVTNLQMCFVNPRFIVWGARVSEQPHVFFEDLGQVDLAKSPSTCFEQKIYQRFVQPFEQEMRYRSDHEVLAVCEWRDEWEP
jgi:hypothetical protein